MNFEYPEVFYALPVLAIPILVHLFNFRKYQRITFSNVQFLKEIQQQQASRTHLRERMVLTARLLIFLFVLLAFSRPYFAGRKSAADNTPQVISIFVDNSYSMQTLNPEGRLLDEAKRRAKEIVAAYQSNTRFQLLTQDFEGQHQRLLTAEEFDQAVDTLTLSTQSRSLQQIISRQQNFLNLQPQTTKSYYVVSDFQQNLATGKLLQTDTSASLNFVKIEAAPLPNLAVDSILLLNAVHRPAEQEKLVIRIRNYSDKAAISVPVRLLINGVQKAVSSISLRDNSAGNDTVTFSELQAGWQQAQIQLQDNPVTFDNTFYFSFNVQPHLPLLLINGRNKNQYLTAAFGTDSFFKPDQISSGSINYATLSQYPVIFISDVETIPAGLAQQLQNYVRNGGTLMVFPAGDANAASYQQLLRPLNAPWPGQLLTEETKVLSFNAQHPVWKGIFEHFYDKPDLPIVHKYYKLNLPVEHTGKALLMLPGNDPFISGYPAGKGMVYLSAVPLDEGYSNLPKHALLLPMLFRVALLSKNDAALYHYIGQDERITFSQVGIKEKQPLYLTKGAVKLLPDVQLSNGIRTLYVADQVKQPGMYRLTVKDSLLAVFAFNNSRSESDLHYLSREAVQKMLPAQSRLINAGAKPITTALAEANKGLHLWKVCLILALFCIAAEIWLVRYFNKSGIT
ncbi:BatA domain-containing protein [Mucilaginibacter sp.]